MTALNNSYAPRYRQWHELAGISTKEMASMIGLDLASMTRLEEGHEVKLSPKHLRRLIDTYFSIQEERGWPMQLRWAFFLWGDAFGTELARRRKAVKLLQSELAKRAKVRWETLNRLEQGKHKPRMETLRTIIRALEEAEKGFKKDGYVEGSSLAERNDFAGGLKKMRLKLNLEPEDLAGLSGMGIESILAIEEGRRVPHPSTLKILKRALQKGKTAKRK